MTLKLDFHVHTKYSIDSLIEPKDLVAKSRRLGVIPAIADHNGIEAHAAMRALKAEFIPAEEIFTDRGDLIGLYMNEEVPKKTPFAEAIDLIHSQGGLAYLPHMYDFGRSGRHPREEDAAKVDIIEVFNARCIVQAYNERASSFAQSHNLPGATGSDSHFLMEFGSTYTILPDFEIDNPRALLKALIAPKSASTTQNTKPESQYPKLVKRPAFPLVRGTTTFVSIGKKLLRRFSL